MENNNEVLNVIHGIEAELREYIPIIHQKNEEIVEYFINNGTESPNAKTIEELSNKCKTLIIERYRLYRSINLIPKYNLPKDMLLDEIDEKEKDDSEFIVIVPTPEDAPGKQRTVKPWDFLNSNTEYANEETSQERYNICKGCPEFINLSKQCKKCGCFMSAKTRLAAATCPIGKWGYEENKEEIIFISIASYRDPDLVNTVKSAWDKAKIKDSLFFSIVSQAKEDEHPDLSFIPKNQIDYIKFDWTESKGACWAREIASRNVKGTFFFQIDSHSRFKDNWDIMLKKSYKECQSKWGEKIILSNYPDSYTIDWDTKKDILEEFENFFRLRAEWDETARMIVPTWEACESEEFGHEVFFVSANNLFCLSEIIKEVPYDGELYFTGEEPSLSLRFYTRGIKIINPPIRYMYTNYDRENGKRNFHWNDKSDSWWKLDKLSYQKLAKILTGDLTLGQYGIGSVELFKKYQENTGIFLEDKFDIIYGK